MPTIPVPPTLAISTTPNVFDPVNAPIWFTFTSSFGNSTATLNDSNLIVDLQILDQSKEISTVIDFPGRFKIPPRTNSIYVYNPANILKSYVTFPFDKKNVAHFVNENSGTASATLFVPETEGIVKYNLHYGIEYNPHATFSQIVPHNSGGFTYSLIEFPYNGFANNGDVITIQVYSGLFSYYNCTASIVNITNGPTWTDCITDIAYNAALGAAYGNNISGIVTNVQHFTGTTSAFYAYNGTRQYYEKDVNMGSKYIIGGTGSGVTLGTATGSFMTDYGYDINHPLPIKPGQGERVRFLADLYGSTGFLTLAGTPSTGSLVLSELDWQMEVYDSNRNLLTTTSYPINLIDTATVSYWANKCFTATVFDEKNSIPITGGYYYHFSIVMNLVLHIFDTVDVYPMTLGEIWYRGDTKCSRYDNVRIKFLNRQGSWNYWNFNKDKTQTTTIEKIEFKRPTVYDYTLNFTKSNYTTSKLRGQTILSSNVQETFTLNSDWVTESEYAFLNQLVTSPEVYIFYDTYIDGNGKTLNAVNIPIIITDTSYVWKTLNKDRLFNLTISYKYGFDTNLQNQ